MFVLTFHLPYSKEELEKELSLRGKPYSLDAITTEGCYVYRIRKHSLMLRYLPRYRSFFKSMAVFHALLMKEKNGTKIIGVFDAAPLFSVLVWSFLLIYLCRTSSVFFALFILVVFAGLNILESELFIRLPIESKDRILYLLYNLVLNDRERF